MWFTRLYFSMTMFALLPQHAQYEEEGEAEEPLDEQKDLNLKQRSPIGND